MTTPAFCKNRDSKIRPFVQLLRATDLDIWMNLYKIGQIVHADLGKDMDSGLLTPKQVARAIGVSESSLKRWCDRGIIHTVKTAGGHRRLAINEVMQYLRDTGQTLVRPDVLGLPSAVGTGKTVIERARQQTRDALLAGDELAFRRIVIDMYLGRHTAASICDNVIAAALNDIGDLWECGTAEVYQERRGCELCVRVLYELRTMMRLASDDAPVAIGGTLSGDPYKMAVTMVEIALREVGWNAESIGIDLPAETFCQAVQDIRPELAWISVSSIHDNDEFLTGYRKVYETTSELGIPLVVGGKAMVPELRSQIEYNCFCDRLQHLLAFVKTLPRGA